MKKGLIIGKRQFLLAGLVLVLGVAVWANMRLAAADGGLDISAELTSSKYLGEAQLVDNPTEETQSDATQVSAKVEEDLITQSKTERDKARQEAVEQLEETIDSAKSKGADVTEAVNRLTAFVKQADDERAIEQILQAKGFSAVVSIGDTDVNVMVDSGELLSNQTMQIRDAVQGVCGTPTENIKIVSIK